MTSSPNTRPGAVDADVDLLALDRQVCFALAVASRTVIGVYRPILEPMGLTHPQYLVMLALWERRRCGYPRSPSASASSRPPCRRCSSASRPPGTSGGSATRADERAVAVTLTPSGRRLRRRAERIPAAVIERLGMEVADLEDIRDRLTSLIDATRRTG